jgi:hypothetical protein
MDAGKVAEKVIVEDRQLPILGELHVHLDHARPQGIGQPHRFDSILDRQAWILAGAIRPDAMVPNGNRSNPTAQEIFRRAPGMVPNRFILGGRRSWTSEPSAERNQGRPNDPISQLMSALARGPGKTTIKILHRSSPFPKSDSPYQRSILLLGGAFKRQGASGK